MAYRKKLIEVSLPLDAINAASAREKSIRHGHPSTLHLWWARRPLAACRAVLFGQLVDDPSSCPEEFPTEEEQNRERDRLHGIIESIVPWEASTNELALHQARYEIARSVARNGGLALPTEWRKASHAKDVIDYLQKHAPPIHDPFCGGGSIPLEAQRLGLRARGSDINPVAVLISKALIEFPPRFAGMSPVNPEADLHKNWNGAEGLADDVRYYGRWMRDEARKRIGQLYPEAKLPGGGEAKVIAWLWARTIASPDPRARGAHVPLSSSFVLSTKRGREAIVVPIINHANMTWRFEVRRDPSAEEITRAKAGTVKRQGGTCLLTGTPMPFSHIRAEGKAGRMRERLMAVVADGKDGRIYLSPTNDQEELALSVDRPEIEELDQPLPHNPRNFNTPIYGLDRFEKLFTARQLTALKLFSDLVGEARELARREAEVKMPVTARGGTALADDGSGSRAYADAVATYLSFAVSKASSRNCSVALWESGMGRLAGAFGRQALPMQWSYAETNPLAGAGGDIAGTAASVAEVLDALVPISEGTVQNRDAALNEFLPGTTFSTDPPYYDNVIYSDLSDFFYCWLRRSVAEVHPSLFRRLATPKKEELVASPYRHGGPEGAEQFFLEGMSSALRGFAKAESQNPVCIYYAFKQSEAGEDGLTSAGWASFLQAIVDCGLIIDGTWPVRTEATNALKAAMSALASSIVLVCRDRDVDAEKITRAEFLRSLRAEMPEALSKIRAAGVGPTDIPQAAFGPGIGIFTRYAAVLNPDGSTMSVRDALKLINQVREELASEAQGDYDPATRFAIDWFHVHGHRQARSGEAITIANALGLGLADLERAGIFKTGEGQAQLMSRDQLREDWSPKNDRYPTVWEACQHLIRRLEAADGGVDMAAKLFADLGALAEPAHQLAFRLYDICNNKGWAAEAQPYNNLIQEWDVIEQRALEFVPEPPAQGEMAL